MLPEDAARIVNNLLRREGGLVFTNRADDRGGPTFAGVTQGAWDDYRRRWQVLGPASVKDLNEATVRAFYQRTHVDPLMGLDDYSLADLVADATVQHGSRGIKWLQSAVGAITDGLMGGRTTQLANMRPAAAYAAVLTMRLRFYATIATDQLPADPDAPNLRGWINRVCEFIR